MAEASAYLTSEPGCESTWDFGRAHDAILASWQRPATHDRHASCTMGNPGKAGKCANPVSSCLFRYPNQHREYDCQPEAQATERLFPVAGAAGWYQGVTPCA